MDDDIDAVVIQAVALMTIAGELSKIVGMLHYLVPQSERKEAGEVLDSLNARIEKELRCLKNWMPSSPPSPEGSPAHPGPSESS